MLYSTRQSVTTPPSRLANRRSAKFKEILLRLLIVDREADVKTARTRETHGAVVHALVPRARVYLECDMVNVECKLVM